MGLSRKERRALAAERRRRGLPKAKPWTYRKQNRIARMEGMFRQQDEQIARELKLPLALVQHFRKSVTERLETG
jgi:hypothetical protein